MIMIKANIIKINTKLIKIDIGYAIFNSNIRGKGEYKEPYPYRSPTDSWKHKNSNFFVMTVLVRHPLSNKASKIAFKN